MIFRNWRNFDEAVSTELRGFWWSLFSGEAIEWLKAKGQMYVATIAATVALIATYLFLSKLTVPA